MEEKNIANEFLHVPVLLQEVLENLNIRENGTYVDGTLGGAGHSSEIYRKLKKGTLIGIDQDNDAINAAILKFGSIGASIERIHSNCLLTARSKAGENNIFIFRSNYENFNKVLDEAGIEKADGILLDQIGRASCRERV